MITYVHLITLSMNYAHYLSKYVNSYILFAVTISVSLIFLITFLKDHLKVNINIFIKSLKSVITPGLLILYTTAVLFRNQ